MKEEKGKGRKEPGGVWPGMLSREEESKQGPEREDQHRQKSTSH